MRVNEQIASVDRAHGTLEVNAIHVNLLSGEDIVVSSAVADISCDCAD